MLMLRRKPNQSIMIGDEIVVTVLGVEGNYVTIGIRAPKDTAIDRSEIRAAKLKQKTNEILHKSGH